MIALVLSIGCLIHVLIAILVVAIIVSLIIWVIGYLGLGIPAIITKLIVILGVVICVYYLLMCLVGSVP